MHGVLRWGRGCWERLVLLASPMLAGPCGLLSCCQKSDSSDMWKPFILSWMRYFNLMLEHLISFWKCSLFIWKCVHMPHWGRHGDLQRGHCVKYQAWNTQDCNVIFYCGLHASETVLIQDTEKSVSERQVSRVRQKDRL